LNVRVPVKLVNCRAHQVVTFACSGESCQLLCSASLYPLCGGQPPFVPAMACSSQDIVRRIALCRSEIQSDLCACQRSWGSRRTARRPPCETRIASGHRTWRSQRRSQSPYGNGVMFTSARTAVTGAPVLTVQRISVTSGGKNESRCARSPRSCSASFLCRCPTLSSRSDSGRVHAHRVGKLSRRSKCASAAEQRLTTNVIIFRYLPLRRRVQVFPRRLRMGLYYCIDLRTLMRIVTLARDCCGIAVLTDTRTSHLVVPRSIKKRRMGCRRIKPKLDITAARGGRIRVVGASGQRTAVRRGEHASLSLARW
jgi:hypothetical protein